MTGRYAMTDDGHILMRCLAEDCEADGNGTFWAEMDEDFVDDHFGGYGVWIFPEDAPCPKCGEDSVEVEVPDE